MTTRRFKSNQAKKDKRRKGLSGNDWRGVLSDAADYLIPGMAAGKAIGKLLKKKKKKKQLANRREPENGSGKVRPQVPARKVKKYKDLPTRPSKAPLPLKKEKMMAPEPGVKEMDTEYQYPWDTPPSKKTTPSKKKKMYGGKKGKKKKSEFDKLYGDWV